MIKTRWEIDKSQKQSIPMICLVRTKHFPSRELWHKRDKSTNLNNNLLQNYANLKGNMWTCVYNQKNTPNRQIWQNIYSNIMLTQKRTFVIVYIIKNRGQIDKSQKKTKRIYCSIRSKHLKLCTWSKTDEEWTNPTKHLHEYCAYTETNIWCCVHEQKLMKNRQISSIFYSNTLVT